METADASARKSETLPPINHLDLDRPKNDARDSNRRYSSPQTSAVAAAAALVSPTSTMYGGPPPYSSYPPAIGASAAAGGYISPPDSRRTSDDDKDRSSVQPHRQSLPSIHEALGVEKNMSYSPASFGPPNFMPQSNALQQSMPCIPRSHPDPPAQSPSLSFSHSQPPPPPPPQSDATISPNQPQPSFAFSRQTPLPSRATPSNSTDSRIPVLQPLQTASPATQVPGNPCSFNQQSSPAYDSGSNSTATMNSAFSYQNGFSNASPFSRSQSSAAPLSSSYPFQHQSWSVPPWEPPRNEPLRPSDSPSIVPRPASFAVPYSESIKRHLESYDVETSINEILSLQSRLGELGRQLGSRMHQSPRSGPVPSSLPSVPEADEVLQLATRIMDAAARLRDCTINSHAVLAEQRAIDRSYKTTNNYDDDRSIYQDEFKGGPGFPVSDAKKRRGRAAPPGRCHSCNRAETPEWRRGPDGARTLCNACGLHYAKLTRKLGTKPAMGGSSLRPKSIATGSRN